MSEEMGPVEGTEAVSAPEAQTFEPPAVEQAPEQAPESSKSVSDSVGRALKQVSEGQPRDPNGKFSQRGAPPATQTPAQPLPAHPTGVTPGGDDQPPARFSADAKAEWAKAPPAVRGEVQRAIREMSAGLAEHQSRWAPLKPYDELATRSGTTLVQALDHFVGMERQLREDPIKGLELICRNMGFNLQQVAQYVMQQPAKTEAELLAERQMEAHQAQLNQIQHQQLLAIESTLTHFAQAHPRFEELAEEIARMLQTGYAASLEDAYTLADRLNPGPPVAAPAPAALAAQPATPRAAPQPSMAGISMQGAPGSSPAKPRSSTVTDAVSRALSAVSLN